MQLVENEKRILSLARNRGAISMPDVSGPQGVGCAWATASKLMKRLTDHGLLQPVGTKGRSGRYGKSARVFLLNESRYCAIGIDIEKTLTHAVVTTLGGKTLWKDCRKSPSFRQSRQAVTFIYALLETCLARAQQEGLHVYGAGVGIPRPALALQISLARVNALARRRKLAPIEAVVVENNVSALADYLRFTRQLPDFALIAIRTGVGGGLVVGNQLLQGTRNTAQFGHIDICGVHRCPCGQAGCLESEIALPALIRKYREAGGQRVQDPNQILSAADRGDSAAGLVRDHLIVCLEKAIRILQAILDLPQYLVAGRFGDGGKNLIARLQKRNPGWRKKLRYLELGADDFVQASANLVHRDFLSGSDFHGQT